MKTSINKIQSSSSRASLLAFAIFAALFFYAATNANAQSKKSKKLANVTFSDEYVRKANEKAIMENLQPFVLAPVEKKVNSMQELPDGRYLFLRVMENPAVGDNICLTKTDSDGNVVWERTYKGDGFSNEPDNFMKKTRDGGYLIQRSICAEEQLASPSLTQVSATK